MIKLIMQKKSFHLKFIKSLFFLISFLCYADIYNSQQLIPAGHWIYDALYSLNSEEGRLSIADNAPLPVSEIQMYFEQINYDNLSDSGKDLYNKVEEYFSNRKFSLKMGGAFVGFNAELNPEFLYKSNDNLDWTFATDYTGSVNDGASSGFMASKFTAPLLKIPLYIGFSDYVMIQTDPAIGKSYWGFVENNNFINLPTSSSDFEFLWPRTAYGSIGKAFNGWGINVHVGKEGLQHGRTSTGSIIYNSTFETDGYFQLNLYCPKFRYNLDVVQVDYESFLYMHSFDATPFKWVKFGVVEATYVSGPFELRYLNPLMIMHSFGAWDEYGKNDTQSYTYYGEPKSCQYMGIHVDLMPVKHLRIYWLYAQNETQSSSELSSKNGSTIPDGFGHQLGFEFTFPGKNNDWWIGNFEGIYTTPFLYFKPTAESSLYRARYNMQSNGGTPICSWIGTPLGPDSIGLQTSLKYEKNRKWSCELSYLFVAHGTNSFNLFDNTVTIDGEKYYDFYPSVKYKILREYEKELDAATTDEQKSSVKTKYKDFFDKNPGINYEQIKNEARDYKLTGNVQFTNQIAIKGSYILNKHFSFNGQLAYTFVFNNQNIIGNFEHGVELEILAKCSLF